MWIWTFLFWRVDGVGENKNGLYSCGINRREEEIFSSRKLLGGSTRYVRVPHKIQTGENYFGFEFIFRNFSWILFVTGFSELITVSYRTIESVILLFLRYEKFCSSFFRLEQETREFRFQWKIFCFQRNDDYASHFLRGTNTYVSSPPTCAFKYITTITIMITMMMMMMYYYCIIRNPLSPEHIRYIHTRLEKKRRIKRTMIWKMIKYYCENSLCIILYVIYRVISFHRVPRDDDDDDDDAISTIFLQYSISTIL